MTGPTIGWDEIMDTCSRLHTTRRRPAGPWPDAELREDSQVLKIVADGRVARITPTRMFEPGFYWRYADQEEGSMNPDAEELHKLADEGKVERWLA